MIRKEDGLNPAMSLPVSERKRAPLTDAFGRRMDHIRISVTSACDLRCVYCRPGAKAGHEANGDDLSDTQRVEFIRYLYDRHGLSQVRLTGGEPLLYPKLSTLVAKIRHDCPDLTMAVTTNGRLLSRFARDLRNAGLDRLNVSLDSLDENCYRRMTGGSLSQVIAGLDAAGDAGFPPPKINTVVLRDLNDAEVTRMAEWAIARGSEIRFLEAMPIGAAGAFNKAHFVAASESRRRLAADFALTALATPPGATATRFRAISGALDGIIGTIAPVSEPFCSSCRRIRLTADGHLFPCLLDAFSVDMRPVWRSGCLNPVEVAARLDSAVRSKQERGSVQPVQMIQLGG